MRYNGCLVGKTIFLRTCEIPDCTDEYVAWLNDSLVNQYLETRWNTQTLESITEFVKGILESDHSYLFAIIAADCDKHVGNIKIGPIHPHYKYADISYFIGDRNYWGKGIATQAINLVSDFGFKDLRLHRIQAGVFEKNVGSTIALERAGFIMEGYLRNQLLDTNGEWQNHLFFGKLNGAMSSAK